MSRAPWVIDLVAYAMVLIVPLLAFSIWQVQVKKAYATHKKMQVVMGVALLVTILTFEIDIRINGWRQYAESSPYYDTVLFPFLAFHVTLATSTTLLWIWLILTALKRFASPPVPNDFSRRHRFFARIGAGLMFSTAVTGWIFYYLAFVA